MELFQWIEVTFHPTICTTDQLIYNDLDSQSGYSLPLIYQPFDSSQRSHWLDRGCLYDFYYSIQGEGKKVLDFGPGDGWPSLILAPYVKEVVGIDASETRVAVCRENAKRLQINNATFLHYSPGSKLPFQDGEFDCVVAASSLEQSPNPKEALAELYRVLKPGGVLRITYESLASYENGQEEELWLMPLGEGKSKLILYQRNIQEETAVQYALSLALPYAMLQRHLPEEGALSPVKEPLLNLLIENKDAIGEVKKSVTLHPSGKTLVQWMKTVGFKEIKPTHGGGRGAAQLFAEYPHCGKGLTMAEVDQIIKPVVKIVTTLAAPLEMNPPITAIK